MPHWKYFSDILTRMRLFAARVKTLTLMSFFLIFLVVGIILIFRGLLVIVVTYASVGK